MISGAFSLELGESSLSFSPQQSNDSVFFKFQYRAIISAVLIKIAEIVAVIILDFPAEAVVVLREQSQNHPHPSVRLKAQAVLMKSQGIAHGQIQATLDITGNTLRSYLRTYASGGTLALELLRFYQPAGRLDDHQQSLSEYFAANPPASIKQAAASIKELTGVSLGLTQTRKFVKNLGLKRRMVGTIPARANPEIQERFIEEKLEPLLAEAREGTRTVFFVDAAHFVFAAFLGYLWSVVRVFVRSPSGRQRFNVLGALDAVTHEMITVTNTTYINALSVCELLDKIAATYLAGPITLVLDNARYQRCDLVTNKALELGIELLFLPPYSPNLNLIERMWKFVKKECLRSKYYKDFESFSNSISQFIDHVDANHSNELQSLLTHKFQKFSAETVA